jgi:hypothetical protein
MYTRIYLYANNESGLVGTPDWDEISGDIEFELKWRTNDEITAKNIIIPQNFSKGSFSKPDNTITNIRFINNINLDIIINGYFLIFLQKLKTIDLEGLSKTKRFVGNFFLSYCYELEEIDISQFANIEYIGSYFLSNCHGIKKIDLSQLKNITIINNNFLCNCRNLEEVDLTQLKNITEIGESFLACCFSLKGVKFYHSLNVKKIGSQFMRFCKSLTNINLTSFTKIDSVDDSFLEDCEKLENIMCHENTAQIITERNEEISLKLNYLINQFQNNA